MKAPASWEVRFEEPDIVFMRPVGMLPERDMKAILDELASIHRTRRVRFHRVDFTCFDGLDRAARKLTSKRVHEVRPEATVVYGASAPARAGLNLVLGAANLLGRLDFPVKFVATEAEARAWIEARRR